MPQRYAAIHHHVFVLGRELKEMLKDQEIIYLRSQEWPYDPKQTEFWHGKCSRETSQDEGQNKRKSRAQGST